MGEITIGRNGQWARWIWGEVGKGRIGKGQGEVALGEMGKKLGEMGMGEMGINR
jgi:hypothetical protein